MDITINTTTIASKAKRLAKWLFLSFFSTGWLYALCVVVMIPADMMTRNVEETKRDLEATDRYAKLVEKGSKADQQEVESAKREIEFIKTTQLQSSRLDRQLLNLEQLKISVIILCVWLALVIVFWSWRLGIICNRFNAGIGRDSPSP